MIIFESRSNRTKHGVEFCHLTQNILSLNFGIHGVSREQNVLATGFSVICGIQREAKTKCTLK